MRRALIGFGLAIVAFVSYPLFFARFPVTRDIPWATFLLFVVATTLLVSGVRQAKKKLWPVVLATLGIAIFAFSIIGVTVLTRMLPASHNAPKVGDRAPEFALRDTAGQVVTLSSLTASAPRGVVLIFYRGYW